MSMVLFVLSVIEPILTHLCDSKAIGFHFYMFAGQFNILREQNSSA